ncbi:hypothetical protein TH63_06570 [Rufibacter radiotolerans]|uniref:Glycosyltransferase RgtA/B/C/D-like domain-containing protein n=1 Tax=Rufibacter radiotolerans TaxID=1379910 RepID=A0A0H4VJ19_9BACT|nr:glycosyltransferase family 39 protein [Rufibacter radiotolerans]AKQ45378.1 hypothetical protein TH63_06570 [Rufibacter radiotolerans]
MPFRPDFILQNRWLPLGVLLGLLLVYGLFPTHNSTSDAYDYAACVRWRVDLWQPHHLLYNITGLGIFTLGQKTGLSIQPLELLKLLNALFAGASLWVLWRILALLQQPLAAQAALLLLAGASLGPMRYATENETYILPIFFSLAGTYYWVRYHLQGKSKDILWSSFWAAFACLFHQIHIFWWLGLLLYFIVTKPRPWAKVGWYLLPALVVPLGYGIALSLLHIPFSQAHRFVFLDFFKGEVETTITFKNFLLTGISFMRTFLEVHGRQLFLLEKNLLYILPALGSLVLLFFFGRKLGVIWRNGRLVHPRVLKTLSLILFLQVLFAWFAVGNAEFMVMVPFLVALMAGCFRFPQPQVLFLPGMALFLWNMSYAVLPNFYFTYSNHACVQDFASRQPQATLLLQDKNAFDAYLFYQTGQYHPRAFETEASPHVLQAAIAQARMDKRPVVTDYSQAPAVISRAWLLRKGTADGFFRNYQFERLSSCPTFYGDQGLYLLK